MRATLRTVGRIAVAAALVLAAARVRAEVIDEIVAKVNDDIITKSDLDTEEQGILQELYRRLSGHELDDEVKKAKEGLLRNLIDRKVLLQRAGHLFDMTKMQDYYLQSFKEQQNIASDKDLEKLLAQEGMTVAAWKKRLVEYFAPQQVLRAEVADRIAISEAEARAYYDAHIDHFTTPAEASVREIVIKTDAEHRAARRAEALAVREKAIAPGADFDALAKEYSESGTKTNGGLLGTVKRGDLAGALDDAAFTVPVGSVSELIETEYGFHLLKVAARTDATITAFDSARTEVENILRNEQMKKQTAVYLKKAWAETTIWIAPAYQARLSPEDAAP